MQRGSNREEKDWNEKQGQRDMRGADPQDRQRERWNERGEGRKNERKRERKKGKRLEMAA